MTTRFHRILGAGLLLASVAACTSSSPLSEPPSPLEERMYVHFNEAIELRGGAIFGDLEGMRRAGTRLESLPAPSALPASAETYMTELRVAAQAAANATTVAQAQEAAADVARSCGTCHQPFEVGPRFVIGGPPPGESLTRHMMRQSRISRLLWEGLLAPSDELWEAGAAELANEPAFPQEVATRVQDSEILDQARADLRALGAQARTAPGPYDKAAVLAQVWGVCSGCHQVAGTLGQD